MSQGEIKYYLADAKTRKEIDSAKKEESEFDSDLNRSMYQEYWTDLKEFKTKKQMREAARKANQAGGLQRKAGGFSGRNAASLSHANVSSLLNSSRTPRSLAPTGASLANIVSQPGGMTPRLLQTQNSIDGVSHNNLPSIFQRSNFMTAVRDPDEATNREIDPQFIVPKLKFDTVFDEYMDRRKQFDHLRSAVKQGDGDTQKNEAGQLKNKIEMQQKAHAIEMRQAKEMATRNANQMIQERLE